MSAKRSSRHHATAVAGSRRSSPFGATPPSRGRATLVAVAAAIAATLALGAAPSLADTGSVYVASNGNVGAGSSLFASGSFGGNNVGLGYTVMPNHPGSGNVALGDGALYTDGPGGDWNVATGTHALFNNTGGQRNIAAGYGALAGNTTGSDNVAAGYQALYASAAGDDDIATGTNALYHTTG